MTVRPTGIGERYGLLTLVSFDVGRARDNRVLALWRCDCGSETTAPYARVKRKPEPSCGCVGRDTRIRAVTKHGGRRTPEYSSWQAMKRRCEVPTDKDYPRYGGAGVTVSPEWSASFEAFRSHLGPRAAGTTIDRIDTRLGYEPGNVRWATAQQQGRNRRATFIWHIRGRQFETAAEAAAAFSVSEHTVWRWVNGQFDPRRDRMTPPRPDCRAVERYAS